MSAARRRRALLAAIVGCAAGCAAAGDGFPPPSYPLSRSVEEPFRSTVPRLGPIAPWTPPVVEQWTMPNGLRVLFSPRAGCDLVSMSVVAYRAGYADSIAESGDANTLVEMLASGTRSHPSAAHAAALRGIGAAIHQSIDAYSLALVVTSSREHREAALSLLAESAIEPELSELEFRRVIRAQAEQRRRSVRSPSGVAYRSITRMLFGTQSAFAASWTSSIESIATRSRAAVTRFYSERFVPSRVAVVVTGDATRAEVEAMVQRSFGAWNAPAPPIPERAHQSQFPSMPVPWRVYENYGSAQASVFLGFRLPGRAAPDFAAAGQAHRVFAESFGSRLSSSIRESLGLAYSIDGAIESTEEVSLSWVSMSIDGASAQRVLAQVLVELRRMHARPVRAIELRAAQASHRNALFALFESVEDVRSVIGALPGRGLTPSTWTTALESVDRVTREQVLEATHRYFDERSMAVVIVGDRGQLAQQVLAVSPVSALLEDEAP